MYHPALQHIPNVGSRKFEANLRLGCVKGEDGHDVRKMHGLLVVGLYCKGRSQNEALFLRLISLVN